MKRNKSKFFGLIIIVFAVYQLASALGFVVNGLALGLVAAILLLYGLISLYQKNFFFGTYALAYASLLVCQAVPELRAMLPNDIPYWTIFWMSTLIGFGLQMVFGKSSFRKSVIFNNGDYTSFREERNETYASDYTSEYVDIDVSLGATTRYIYSPNLKETSVSSKLGSATVYFQERTLSNDLVIFVSCRMGNIERYLPKEWNVEDEVSVNLGNIELNYPRYQADTQQSPYTVFIKGDVSLGNIEINFI